RDILAPVRPGVAKAKLADQRGEIVCLGFTDGEFDESNAAAFGLGWQARGGGVGRICAKLILEQDQRTQPVGCGADRGASAELVVENFQRQRPRVAGREHRLQKVEYRKI